MKIKKLEKLQDLLDKDMVWRRKELIDIKLLIDSTQNPTLCRAGIALLSAHFEGFIKQAANYYVVYVASQNIILENLRTNFAAIYLKNTFYPCTESEKTTVYKKAIDTFITKYKTRSFKVKYSPDNPVISTESNPSSSVVKEIFATIGLDFSPYETKTHYIDSDLLRNRHGIVHGENLRINISEFNSTFKIIIDIMEQFSKQVLDAAINKDYLQKNIL